MVVRHVILIMIDHHLKNKYLIVWPQQNHKSWIPIYNIGNVIYTQINFSFLPVIRSFSK